MLGTPGKMRRKPFSRASFSSFEPGSVTAMKCLPASVWPMGLMRGSASRVSALANGICVCMTQAACGSLRWMGA